MEDLLEFLARSLVDEPDEVSVESFEEDDGTIVLELHVAEDDAGKVIGRGGRTVAALRTVVKAAAVARRPAGAGRRGRLTLVTAGRVGQAARPGRQLLRRGAAHELPEGCTVLVRRRDARTVERRAGTDDRPLIRLDGRRRPARALRGELAARARHELGRGRVARRDLVGCEVAGLGSVRRVIDGPRATCSSWRTAR